MKPQPQLTKKKQHIYFLKIPTVPRALPQHKRGKEVPGLCKEAGSMVLKPVQKKRQWTDTLPLFCVPDHQHNLHNITSGITSFFIFIYLFTYFSFLFLLMSCYFVFEEGS